jgi:hypothetical protein
MKIKLTKRDKPDFSELKDLVECYIQDLQKKGITSDELSDYEGYIFEASIQAIYGDDCWNEINKITVNL